MLVNATWHLKIGVLSERAIDSVQRGKGSVSLPDRILLSLNSGTWVTRNNAALCEAQSESWSHDSKNCQNWLMPNLRVWVTVRLAKNTRMIPVVGKGLSSLYIQNNQSYHNADTMPWRSLRGDTGLYFGFGCESTLPGGIRCHWFYFVSGWIWQLDVSFFFAASRGIFLSVCGQ